jgi:hypothetical protein
MFDTAAFCGMDWFSPASAKPPPPKVATPADDRVDTRVSPGVPVMNVNDAWHLFGFPRKRAMKDEVKARYLSLIVENHPDRHMADEKTASENTVLINAAWTLLQRHCKW